VKNAIKFLVFYKISKFIYYRLMNKDSLSRYNLYVHHRPTSQWYTHRQPPPKCWCLSVRRDLEVSGL